MAGWRSAGNPTNGGCPPDGETAEIAGVLGQINRAGLWTDFSQPGEVGPETWQRAAVSGFCDEARAQAIYRGVALTDLIVLVYKPGTAESPWLLPITVEVHDGPLSEYEEPLPPPGARIFTWFGTATSPLNLIDTYLWLGGLSLEAVHAVVDSWQVFVIDPHWGRKDYLWPRLLAALTSPADVETCLTANPEP